jgi:hypothetical protein
VGEIVTTLQFNNYYKKWYPNEDKHSLYYNWRIRSEEPSPLKVPGEPLAFDWQNLTDNAIVVKTRNDYYWNHFKDFKIYIKVGEIIPGQKYNDLCISEIILVGTPRQP